MILSADIGGTKTNVALFAAQGKSLRPVAMETYASREHQSLDEIIDQFRAVHRGPTSRACFGVAGPVKHGKSETTNLPWVVDSTQLARKLGLQRVGLLNDMEATAWGIAALNPQDIATVNPGGADPQGNLAVIAAGTGLGEAGLQWNGKEHLPFASEGGHSDFAPRNDLEVELLRYLTAQFGRVSYERVVSGPGLHNIYRFFRDIKKAEEPVWLGEELSHGDPAAVISRVALEGRAPICERALDQFVQIYGAEAGNLALKMMATAGVYLGGGIAPKIAQRLKSRDFLDAFFSKGRLRPLMEQVPVRIVLNDGAALLGAARWALRQGPVGWQIHHKHSEIRRRPSRAARRK
jgi:glucokinase